MKYNHLTNGRFEHDVDGWSLSGASYLANDGSDHFGMAVLAQDEYIEQAFSVLGARLYIVHAALKSSGAIVSGDVTFLITDGKGNTVLTWEPDVPYPDYWIEVERRAGFVMGTTYTLRITNNQAEDVKIDDIWIWAPALSRREVAIRVHEKLGALAQGDVNLNYAAQIGKGEGDYTFAIDGGLRQIGAIDEVTNLPEIRAIDVSSVDLLIDAVEKEMVERIENEYITKVDLRVGPHSESFSQIGKALREKQGSGGASTPGGRVVMRKLTHD